MSDLDLYLIQIRPRDVRKPKEFQLSRHYFFKRNSEALVENEISVTELELSSLVISGKDIMKCEVLT